MPKYSRYVDPVPEPPKRKVAPPAPIVPEKGKPKKPEPEKAMPKKAMPKKKVTFDAD